MPDPIGQDAAARITQDAAQHIRREIDQTGGREVFFAGTLDAQGRVESVRVCARGDEESVLAFLEMLAPKDVVLHNHPGGDIGPSGPDLDIAAACGNNGHGFYIVDSDVTRVYAVVEPLFDKDLYKLDAREMARAFRPDSRMARLVPQFEVRPQQAAMMERAARAFNEDGIAVIEAPTGVGKTFAYLIPAVKWAIANRERVVISTRTINLQEQIINKDIPVLRQCIDEKFCAVLVKGRGNYLCRRKLERTLSEATLFDDEKTQAALGALAEWVGKTQDGSLSDLPFVPGRGLWERVCSEADTCGGPRCPAAKNCFVTKARREVARADLIVANHHILFSDLAVKKEMGDFSSLAVLPAYKRVIFDEAHNIEDSATEYFGVEATRNGAVALLGRFVRKERVQERGLIPYIKLKLVKESPNLARQDLDPIFNLIDNELMPALAAVREALALAFATVRDLAAEKSGQIGRDIKWRLTDAILADPDLREVHNVYVMPAVEEIRACVQICNLLYEGLKRLKRPPGELEFPFITEMMELLAYRGRLERLASVLAEVTSEKLQANTVRWIEIDANNRNIVRMIRCPLEVGKPLAEWVYPNLKTIIMTSATLSVQRNFDYLFSRIGLDQVAPDRIEAEALDTPFDYENQALLCIARDMVAPDDRAFLEQTVECIRRVLAITHGHALVLFTSFYALDFAYGKLHEELRAAGIPPLKQGEATRTQLLDRFRAELSSVLFATDSFWEGIDVAGEALQCVILPKLPFRVPTEPIQQARAEAIDGAGGNSFMAYTVPQAVIKFRQGFGRLIRRRSDRGTIVVLDRRVITKYYGKVFLDSLPGVPVIRAARDELYGALKEFYG